LIKLSERPDDRLCLVNVFLHDHDLP
jgi:hypothetical protein